MQCDILGGNSSYATLTRSMWDRRSDGEQLLAAEPVKRPAFTTATEQLRFLEKLG